MGTVLRVPMGQENAELVDDWFCGGRAKPDLVLSPILQILTKLARPPVSEFVDSGEKISIVIGAIGI